MKLKNIFRKIDIDKFNNLCTDLDIAKSLLREYSGGYSGNFDCAEEFYNSFTQELEKLKNDLTKSKYPDLDKFYMWFLPTSAWDDFVGLDGLELANKILGKIEILK